MNHFGIKFLRDLLDLRKAVNQPGSFDADKLVQDFLGFSLHTPKKALTVKLPEMYSLAESQKSHLDEALRQIGIAEVPDEVDFSGTWEGMDDYVFFSSIMQKDADHRSYERSSLDPLIGKVYNDGFQLLADFSVHEVLFGKVAAKSGNLNLEEVHIFPERFKAGRYELSAALDTPNNSIAKLTSLYNLLGGFERNPKAMLLNPEKVNEAVSNGLSLRSRLGALSRYAVPKSNYFSAETDAVIVRHDDTDLFFLFSKKLNKNMLVYFGNNPFSDRSPAELMVLDGEMHQETLASLLNLGIFDVSSDVLDARLRNFEEAYDNAARAFSKPVQGIYPDFENFIAQLRDAQRYFTNVINPDARRSYCANFHPELLDFAAYPVSENPVFHLLLPRLSWNRAIRQYNSTRRFISGFEKADEDARKNMIGDVVSGILFANQQNNDVNCWLYQNHRDFCREAGINFEVLD